MEIAGDEQVQRAVPVMSGRSFAVPDIVLDRAGKVPLQRQVERQLAAAIRSGKLARGSKLPSTRALARMLNVSRGVVVATYEELLARGLIETRERSGVTVRGAEPPLTLSGLRGIVRAAQFPARMQPFEDPDGNGLYLNQK